ncbi:hypothetical protein OAS59_02670 [Pelagibacteraceae bacterium]|nr:hypothetical protein [Pelagibacteraceae bacterium]
MKRRKKKYNNQFVKYIFDHWEGSLSLPKSFWINGFLLNIIVGIPLIYAEITINEISETAAIFFLIYVLFYFSYFVWVNVGIWKSSGKYLLKKKNNKIWSYGARSLVVISVIRVLGETLLNILS